MIRNNPIKHFIIIIAFFGLLLLPVNSLQAHSGGLDRYGCHAGSQPYHCHRGGGGSSAGGGGSNSSDNALCVIGGIVVGSIIMGGSIQYRFNEW